MYIIVINNTRIFNNTITDPGGKLHAKLRYIPSIIDISEKNIANKQLFLNDFPTRIDAETGIIIKAEISKTPTILINNEMNTANIIVIIYNNKYCKMRKYCKKTKDERL